MCNAKTLRVFIVLLSLAGCTVHPAGENEERQAALDAGNEYQQAVDQRNLPVLGANPSRDDLVTYAVINNADVEQQYWQWRAAIEQIPIDGTQATNLAISLSTAAENGAFSLDRTVVGVGNDPMTDIVLRGKLSAAAQRSLENARAAGVRFRKSQFELRAKVLSAYDDYALNAELIRLAEQNVRLLQTIATETEARSRSGMAGQQGVLKAYDELDLAKNDLENMRSQLPIERAQLNALLGREPTAAIPVPAALPASPALAESDQQLLDLAAMNNPELVALADEIRANHEDIELAKLQYYPDFSLAASTDLQGIVQTLSGAFTVPIIREEALRAAVDQAQANLRAVEANRRQTYADLSAQLVDDIATLHDADRQIELLEQTILPRSRQIVALTSAEYRAGNATLLDLLDSQRSLIDIQRLTASLRMTRDKRLVEIESIEARRLDAPPATRP
jgi:outer membrane protein, heavy metal efflux system